MKTTFADTGVKRPSKSSVRSESSCILGHFTDCIEPDTASFQIACLDIWQYLLWQDINFMFVCDGSGFYNGSNGALNNC